MSTVTFPLDTSGILPSNLIPSELHTVTESNYRDYSFIVPNFAPFYVDNFRIIYRLNGLERQLVENVDFNFALPYIAGIRSVGKMLYGAITLNNLDVNGLLLFQYQTLGGEWVVDRLYVLRQLAEKLYNPRTTIWDIVTDKPEIFPPIPHYQDYKDFYGQEQLILAINNIAELIIENSGDKGAAVNHLFNYENPHQVTKDQLGIGNLGNWRLATPEEVAEGTSTDTLVTPEALREAIRRDAVDITAATMFNSFINV